MNLFSTTHERKSLAATTVVMSLVVLLLFFSGMKYLDPPPESGVDVIFGVDVEGMGERAEPPAAAKQEKQVVEKPEQSTQEIPKEDLLAQDNNEDFAVPETPKKQEKKKETPKIEKPKDNPKPVEKPKKPSRETSDALSNILGAANAGGSGTAGQGDGNKAGYQGSLQGSQYGNSYYGDGSGSGKSGKGWGLNGRTIAAQGKSLQNCNEEGRVVVEIVVDRSGRVVKATPGVKGTTNPAPCLLEAAKRTANMHRWNADENAPAHQTGFIVINFKLGE
jgi:hypothetical protein